MSRLIDIDDERFWDILFDEACVEGKQAERIKAELEKIVAFDTEKVVEQLEEKRNNYQDEMEQCIFKALPCHDSLEGKIIGINNAIDIVKKGGVE